MKDRHVRVSKFLSLVLRHRPEEVGLALDRGGWLSVSRLLEALDAHGLPLTLDELREAVRSNDKQRFSFSRDGLSIRASQGHSVEIDLGYEPAEPPALLYHGTAGRCVPSIRQQGLLRGRRQHVHLSEQAATAESVGRRYGRPVVLRVASGAMHADGHVFFRSANGVWLTEHVPARYITFGDDAPRRAIFLASNLSVIFTLSRREGAETMGKRVELLVIDPQVDFCDPARGALYVPGAEHDMARLAAMVRRLKGRLDEVHVTLDSHHFIHIAHPIFWKDSRGAHPPVFTRISRAEVEQGVWTPTVPGMYRRALDYVRRLEQNGRYELTVWPPHCLIGSPGHAVFPGLFAALAEWESRFAFVDYVTKGSNILTEHYSAVQADVPDPADASTQINTRLVRALERADLVAVAGEARTHCLANTVRDVADAFGDDSLVSKLVLLTDASSDIPGFEAHAQSFMREMAGRGMQLSTTTEFLA